MSSIPDRSHILTEQRNPATTRLHTLSAAECVELIRREDHAVLRAVEAASPALTRFIEAIESGFLAGGRLIYLGAGTSGRLGVLDASEAPPTFQIEPGRIIGIIAGGDRALRLSSEGREDEPLGAVPDLEPLNLTSRDAVLGIAAGGTTPYVLGALAWASRRTARPVTGMLSCSPIPVPEGCDHLIVAPTGPEVLTGSTRMKAGSATKMVLNILSTTLMIRSGRVYQNLMIDLRASNTKLRDRAARILVTLLSLDRASALDLLDRAQGSVKLAVVMGKLGLDAPAAQLKLSQAQGRLQVALGEA